MSEEEAFLECINKYKQSHEMHKNIIFCFKDKELKERLKPFLPPHPGNTDHFTEILIDGDTISHKNSPVYIYGEYKKFSREMTQTPLRIKGRLKCQKSVSDFTEQIKEFYKAKEVVFIPSGREDIDVMNLGGRSFLLVIKEPTRNLLASSFDLSIYPEIELINFKKVTKKAKDHILEGERDKKKVYRCLIACRNKIEFHKKYTIHQKTPLRVLHRRANITREREVEILDVEERTEGDFMIYQVELKATAGTYIKEFVNGDFGRTCPSLSAKDSYADLIYLDVLSIESKGLPSEVIEYEIHLNLK
uniref:tRNA pseudouridine(55) synthase n=1 Tax=Nosema bombycis TaxID=27978 RepID=Q15EY4_NOSBO|nr:unknown [Nosema bombycis]